MDLSNKAMLVKLTITQWSSSKFDARATAAAHKPFKTKGPAGRFTKRLIAKTRTADIAKAANEARTFHYNYTLPWKDDGFRLLPSANYMAYTKKMRGLKSKFEKAVRQFETRYGQAIQEAQVTLNGMFNSKDYPDPSTIRSKYGFDTEVVPIADEKDFRVSLGREEEKAIRADIKKRLKKAQADAMKDIWERLYKTVEHIATKLADPKAVFRDSLIRNAVDLVELMPRLNIAEDPNLEKMRKAVAKQLCSQTPANLRRNKKARKKTAAKGRDILDAMAGYMGGGDA